MLRDFEYNPSQGAILAVLSRFKVELPDHIAVVRFEVLSPDSFMWRLLIGNGVYYLYAEDFVSGLNYIQTVFNKYLENESWQFVESKSVLKFEDAAPVKGAVVYNKGDDADEMMKYAVDSEYDFVFLALSNEDPNDAQQSDSAPRGFSMD